MTTGWFEGQPPFPPDPAPGPGWWAEIDKPGTFTGEGALTVAAYPKMAAAVTLSGSGALTSAAYAIVPRGAALSGSGTLSAGAYAIVPRPAALSGAGVLSATAFERYARTANPTGAGQLSAQAIQQLLAVVSLAGTGSLAAAVLARYAQAVALGGAGTLASAAYAIEQDLALMASEGTLSLAAYAVVPRPVALAGAGALSAAAIQQFARTLNLQAAGTLSAAAIQQFLATAALAGVGVLSAAAIGQYQRSVSLVGSGVLSTTTPFEKYSLAVALTGLGALSATAVSTAVASIVGSTSNAGTSITSMPAHAVGQTILMFVYRDGSNTLPTKPAAGSGVPAWVDADLTGAAGASTNSMYVVWFKATATNHTSGVWTGATGLAAFVINNADALLPIGAFGQAYGSVAGTTGYPSPAIDLADSGGASLIVEAYGSRNTTAWNAAPSGHTRQTSVATEIAVNTKDVTTSDGSATQTSTQATASGYATAGVEILTAPSGVIIENLATPIGAASGTAALSTTVTVTAGSKVYALVNAQALTAPSTPTYDGNTMTVVRHGSNARLHLYSYTAAATGTFTVTMPAGLSGVKSLYAFAVKGVSSDSTTETSGTTASFPTTLTAGQVAVLMVGGSNLVLAQISGGRLLQVTPITNSSTAIADARQTITFTSTTTGVNVASITLVLSP